MNTIFLIEDNPADVELFRLALKEAGVECDLVLFDDGRDVIDYIRNADTSVSESAPDLMILDLNLPKNDGLEILQVLRNTLHFAKVLIAVLSSSSSARERASLAEFQIREFIVKPPNLEEYLNIGHVVRNLLEEVRSGTSVTTSTASR
jgi:DNA-binding response OmpR family regulator